MRFPHPQFAWLQFWFPLPVLKGGRFVDVEETEPWRDPSVPGLAAVYSVRYVSINGEVVLCKGP